MSEPITNIVVSFPATAHDRNQNKLMGLDVECEECGKTHRLLAGGWRFLAGNNGAIVYCDGCGEAEAHE